MAEARVVIERSSEKPGSDLYKKGFRWVGRLHATNNDVLNREDLVDRSDAEWWAKRMAIRHGCIAYEIKGKKEIPLPR